MFLHFLLGIAYATSFYIQPFSQFTQEASVVARGTISNIHAENAIASDGSKIIYTYATLELKEVFKGSIHTQSMLIRKVGGTKDGYAIEIPGSPEFKDGEDTVLFLSGEKEDQSHEVQGLELGQYGVEEKDGKQVLTGGIFNYAKHGEHNAGDTQDENMHPWTLAELRQTIEKQGGKEAPPKVTSTPSQSGEIRAAQSAANTSSNSGNTHPQNAEASPAQAEGGSTGVNRLGYYSGIAMVGLLALFFLFRKR